MTRDFPKICWYSCLYLYVFFSTNSCFCMFVYVYCCFVTDSFKGIGTNKSSSSYITCMLRSKIRHCDLYSLLSLHIVNSYTLNVRATWLCRPDFISVFSFFWYFGINNSNTFSVENWIPLKQVLVKGRERCCTFHCLSDSIKPSLQFLLVYFSLVALEGSTFLPEHWQAFHGPMSRCLNLQFLFSSCQWCWKRIHALCRRVS